MKQIDIIKTYSHKRCLVVDDNPDIRTSLKRTLVDFGSANVDTAGNATEAIELSQKNQYNIVLSDYNLGKGKNGQQLLEELRHQQLLRQSDIFIMITAESNVQYVVAALENQPDDYLNKPINRDTLRPRLDAVLLKKEALAAAYKAIDGQRYKSAIDACQAVIEENGKYTNDARRLMSALMCKQGDYNGAIQIYNAFDEGRRPFWADLGLANAYFGSGELDKSEEILNKIIADNPICVEAYDLLAQVLTAKNKPDQAQLALTTAVKVSPLSATRQREMAKASLALGDENAAAHAFRAAIKHSKNSSQESAEDYTGLAQALTQMMTREQNDSLALARESLQLLDQADKRFARQPITGMRVQLGRADVFEAVGNHDKAEQAHQKALGIFESMNLAVVENTSKQACIDCALALMNRGLHDEGEQLLQEVSKQNQDKSLAIKIDKLLREPVTKEGIAFASTLNKKGIGYHQKGQYDKAAKAFEKVLKELPNHIGLNLNLVQSLMSKSKTEPLKERELKLMNSCFKRVGELRENSPYLERLLYLRKRYLKLTRDNEISTEDVSAS